MAHYLFEEIGSLMLEDLLVKGQELRLIVVREGVAGPGAYDKVKFSDS